MNIVECLLKAGFLKPQAKILAWLLENGEGTSQQIEKGTSTRQPEVSLAVTGFCNRCWLTCEHLQHEGKGRPINFYTINREKTLNDIMLMTQEKADGIERKLKDLNELLEECKNNE